MDVERLLLRVVAYGAYASGTGGVALALGGWQGWLVVAVAGMLPGGYLLRQQIEERSIADERARHAPERYVPPQQRSGPAPDALTPPL